MDLVIIIGHLWQGGGERVCVNIANQLARNGYNIKIIVSSLERAHYLNDLEPRVSLEPIGSTRLLDIFLFYMRRLPVNGKVLSFNYNLSFIAAIIRLFKRFSLFSRSISTLTKELERDIAFKEFLKRKTIVWSLNNSNKVIAQSAGMKRDLVANGVKPAIIEVINNPVSPEFRVNEVSREKFILFAGRFSPEKNLFTLIDMLPLIDGEVDLVLAGEGPLREELARYAREKGVYSRLKILGLVSNMEQYYSSAICSVLTSHYEGFPNVLVESIACGTPVVAFDCPSGPAEIIEDGINGYLVEHGDINTFARRVNKLYYEPVDFIRVSRTAKRFQIDYIAERYIDLLRLK